MKGWVLVSALILSFCACAGAQEIKIKEIYQKTITPDYTRYEYVFSVTNHTADRLMLFLDVNLMDSAKKIVDTRFLSFETPEGATETASIESDYAPQITGSTGTTVSFYRLTIRDEGFGKVYEKEGDLKVPVIHKRG
jgi:hypothetical protein